VGLGRQRDKKRRKRDGGRGLARGKSLAGCWATGPKGKRGKLFSFVSFSNSFQNNLSNSNSNQTFLNLLQNFYKYFRIHPSNQKPCKVK
jgi:hypothetical protein